MRFTRPSGRPDHVEAMRLCMRWSAWQNRMARHDAPRSAANWRR